MTNVLKSKGWKYRDGFCHFCDQVMPFKKGYFHEECFKEWFNVV